MTNHDHDINNIHNANVANTDETPTIAQQPTDPTKAYAYDFAQQPRTPMYTANPVPQQDGTAARVHDRLSGKMTAFVVGISLACGLGAGVAGSAIANALHDSGRPQHTAPFAHSTDEQLEQLMPDDERGGSGDMDDMGGGRRGERRQRGEGSAPERSDDSSGSDSKSDSNDSGASGTEKESYYWMQYGDLLGL